MPRAKKNPEASKEPVEVGEVFTYFSKVEVAGIKLTGTLNVGDKILIKGATTNIEQTVDSMQIERQPVQTAGKGDSIGVKVIDRVRPGDKVYRVA
ncbi:MAG: translation elongation factor-like protein [Candidatus Nanoarchaeia archaeon]